MSGIIANTGKNILRNRWLSIATILVATIVFATASFFIAVSFMAQQAVRISETKAQLQIYFEVDTPESQISSVRDKLEKLNGIEEVTYITQEEALALYLDYYSDDPELIDSVSADWLPASLEVRASSLTDLEYITDQVKEEQRTNPYIEEVVYHEDVVKQLRSISNAIRYGAIGIISIFSVITLSLVFITIAFNINAHHKEIEIMHLVGSNDSYIKLPYILEGVVYTTVGSLIAAGLIIVPWYLLVGSSSDSNIKFILTQLATELDLNYLRSFDLKFVILFFGVHGIVGALVGFASSSFAVMKNLNLKSR